MSLNPRTGILIAIEGIDGAGKTTQAAMLEDRLTAAGFEVLRAKEPTAGQYGQRLRDSATTGRLPPEEELELFLADRREHVVTKIRPALDAGQAVILDRYYFSTAAYQGARGMDPEAILAVNETFAPQPDLLILLEVLPSTALARIAFRGDGTGNLFEQQATLERCAEIFATLRRPYLFAIDGDLPPDVIHAAIVRRLDEGPIFRVLCHRLHLAACEPFLCEYRFKGLCEYPGLPLLRPDPGIDLEAVTRIVDGPGTIEEKMARVSDLLAVAKR